MGVAAEKAAAEAKSAKMAAVNKVVGLLEGLKRLVLTEGESEAQTYNKFACFCKDTTAQKTSEIQQGEDEKASLAAAIARDESIREQLDASIAQKLADIAADEKAMKEAEAARAATRTVYEKNHADLTGAIRALEGAISSLKSSKTISLAQFQSVAKTVRTAELLADALGLGGKGAVESLLQANPDVPMEDYKFHSSSIIETLEKLLKDFMAEKQDVDREEVSSRKMHDEFVQEKADSVKLLNRELDGAKRDKATKQGDIARDSARRTTVAATLLDDQEYLRELAGMCSAKASTWDQRSRVRQDELSALTSAIAIVKGAVSEKTTTATVRLAQQAVSVRAAEAMARNVPALEAAEAEAEAADAGGATALLAVTRRHSARRAGAAPRDDGRQRVAQLLLSRGQQLQSAVLTALAGRIAEDPFAKVKTLIQGLIERLLAEAAKESNQKDWCDKSTSDATQKRDYAAGEVERLNANMAELEAARDKLQEELAITGDEIADLKAKRGEAERLRAQEKSESATTTQEAKAGLKAVVAAVDILSKFYKTVAKEEVSYSFGQRAPAGDAPDAGFDVGEAYVGAQGEASGILGMLDVIRSDFERTISETERAEAEAEQEHYRFMTETGKSLAAKTMASGELKRQKGDTEEKLENADQGLRSQMSVLKTSVEELLELKPVCVDTRMSYKERVSRREEEIDALKKGLCILTHYTQYGPGGEQDTC